MRRAKIFVISLLAVISVAHAEQVGQWVSLETENKSAVKRTIITEVDKREGYSTPQEEVASLRVVTDEKAKEDSAFKNGLAAAKAEFVKTKNRRDSVATQLQGTSSEIEELRKEINNIKAGMANSDSQIARFEDDIKTQQDALKKWLKTEKQGEALVAVLYTRGFKDKKHELDAQADELSAPIMAADMGVYIQSHTKVVNNVLEEDFIRAVSQGTAKWNGEEPILIELKKGSKGTEYLRIKRYELYPFQESGNSQQKNKGAGLGSSNRIKVALIGSMYNLGTFLAQNGMYNLETFLAENGHKATSLDLSRVEILLSEVTQNNKLAAEGFNEQVNSIQERIASLNTKIANSRSDKENLAATLARKEALLNKEPMAKLALLTASQKEADALFHAAQAALHAKNSVRETIIVKTVLTTPKGSQSPADAASESIIDKLEEVRNEARSQHSSTTTTVLNGQLVDETTSQAVTQAKIVGMKLVSFINEGDSVKVKIAFRVRMALESQLGEEPEPEGQKPRVKPEATAAAPQKPGKKPAKGAKKSSAREVKEVSQTPPKSADKPPVQPKRRGDDDDQDRLEVTAAIPEVPVPVAAPPSKAAGSVDTEDFQFAVKSAKMSGGVVTVMVDARNKTDKQRYLVLYDQASRYTRSALVDRQGRTHQVQEVFFWSGDTRTSAYDASRGVPVEPGRSLTVELIFKEIPAGKGGAKRVVLHPYSATRFMGVYKWRESELQFNDIAY